MISDHNVINYNNQDFLFTQNLILDYKFSLFVKSYVHNDITK